MKDQPDWRGSMPSLMRVLEEEVCSKGFQSKSRTGLPEDYV